jgi:phosphoglycerate-specific signal transduction histidine kinase
MLPTDRTRIDYVCLDFLHELAEPLTAITCDAGAARRLSESQGFDSRAEITDSLQHLLSETTRANEVIHRFRSFLQKEGKQQLDNIEKNRGRLELSR